MWYPFHSCDDEDDKAFEKRLDSVVREIGDRGKPKPKVKVAVPEGVPPAAAASPQKKAPAPAPAPVAAPAPAPAPVRVPATVHVTPPRAALTAPDPSFTPTMQMQMTSPVAQQGGGMGGGSLMEISVFMKEQQVQAEARVDQAEARADKLEERMERLRQEAKAEKAQLMQEAKAEKAEMEAKMEQQHATSKAEMEQQQAALKDEMTQQQATLKAEIDALKAELTPAPPAPAITQEQLTALQSRIESLHVAKLLADEELYALENLIADYVELTISMIDGRVITRETIYSLATVAAASKLDKLVGLSAAMVGDAAFARQARRKFMQ